MNKPLLMSESISVDFRVKAEARRISQLWREDLNSGLEIATYWVERVMREKGSLDHLKIQDGHLYWWQFYLIDVFSLLLGIPFVAIILFRKAMTLTRCKATNLKKVN